MNNRSSVTVVSVYAGVVAALVGCLGIALAVVGTAAVSAPTPRAKTAFETKLDTAREIREALARPIPQPERLAPITSKPVRVATAKPAPRKPNPEVARQARQAFASIEEAKPPQTFFGFMSFGPSAKY